MKNPKCSDTNGLSFARFGDRCVLLTDTVFRGNACPFKKECAEVSKGKQYPFVERKEK